MWYATYGQPVRPWLRSVWALVACVAVVATSFAGEPDVSPPAGVTQLLPRGGIPAIMNPTFVDAHEAAIPDDAWVLGVHMNGQSRAYDLNLLNHHEIVNDAIGDVPIAPVW